MFLSLASLVQRAMSAACSAELLRRHRHRLDRFAGQLLASCRARLSTCVSVIVQLRTTSAGMPAGPTTPYHCMASKPLKPSSSMVGTSLSCGLRCLAGDGQRAHAARAQVRQRGGQAGEHGLRLPAHQVVDGRRDAAVGDVHHEGVRLLLEQLHRQVRQRAGPAEP
jgi:hypothetical protein